MAPTSSIYLTRHSQAEHNVADDYSIPDAPLTPLGKQQSGRLPALTPDLQAKAQLIISSGLKRTLQSTMIGYAPAIERLGGLSKVVVLPQLQECNDFPCDTGSAREELEADPELAGFDFSNLTPDWTSKQGFYAADEASLTARAQWIRQYLRSRPEQEIVVMAHGDILRRITQQPYPWKNAEVRLFQFDPASVSSDAAPLVHVQDIAAAGSTEPTSGDIANEKGVPIAGVNGVAAPSSSLAEIEERVKERQSAVQSKANELEELEKRLADAERRKRELEAKGISI
ncbi:hypothetical protein ACQY0O_001140 [Thecaphora frezii]